MVFVLVYKRSTKSHWEQFLYSPVWKFVRRHWLKSLFEKDSELEVACKRRKKLEQMTIVNAQEYDHQF